MKKYILLGMLLITTIFAKEWTIMVFINGDNNLDEFAFEDVNELELIGSNNDINIVVQYDRFVANSQANWAGAKRFYIEQDSDATVIASPVLADLGEVDSGDYNSVVDFVTWAKNNYESNKYALIIWDHGSGWQKKSLSDLGFKKMISSDETSGNHISVAEGDYETMLSDIKQVLGKKLDFLGLDACLMGMWEVAFSSENYVDFITFSEETEDATGWQYDNFMTQFAISDLSARELCKTAVMTSLDSVGATLSCVDLSLIPSLTEKINNFATNFKTDTSIDLEILTASASTLTMEEEDAYKDLGGFFTALSLLVDENIKIQWVNPVLDALNATVVLTKGNDTVIANYSESTGMTIYMPLNSYLETIDAYNLGSWSVQTNWNEFISRNFNLDEDIYEPDNSIETAYFNEDLSETHHSIHNNLDIDFIKIALKEGSDYSFETICGSYDTFITLLDENGNILKEDDDGGDERCSRISYYSESNSFVYLKINTYDYESIAVYSLKIIGDIRIDDYPNSINNVDSGDILTNDMNANIEYDGDIDFLYLDVVANAEYTIETVEGSLSDTIIYVYDNAGNLVTENDDISTSLKNYMSKVIFTAQNTERYYIAVEAYEFEVGTYSIKLDIVGDTCEETNNGIEICDGIDNDCDGFVDNNLASENSDNQNGICENSKKICDGINGWIEPDYTKIEAYEDIETICDGLDNDCDGEADNNLVAPNNINQKGVCLDSKQLCTGREGWREMYLFVENYSSKDDTNDDLDNNCDGQIDEGYIASANDGCSYGSNSGNKGFMFFMFFLLGIFSIFRFNNLIYKM